MAAGDPVDPWTKTSNGKCIFWLNGMAGTGKSTISRTVAGRLKGQNLLAASFFFKRGEQDQGNAKLLFSTLAKQLGERVLREQFEKLILQPLLIINQGLTTNIVIVIDALDECDKENEIRIILRLLPQIQKSISVQLQFLLTSRPKLPIRLGFKAVVDKYQDLILHKIPEPVIKHDIKLYFKEKFVQLRQELARAVPLFISATTLYGFISDKRRNPEMRLRAILSDNGNYASKMDIKDFKDIVGVIILLTISLSVNTLARLLDMEPINIQIYLDLLHSVLNVPAKLDKPIDEKEVHRRLTSQCLKVMRHEQYGLKKNICNLQHSGTQKRRDRQSHDPANELIHAFSFFKVHLLHWIEAMSLLGIVSEAVGIIQRLQSVVQVSIRIFYLPTSTKRYRIMIKIRNY
ncbi:hypothetical protein BDV26DRAFT_280726 [Aspergillus bertholletiae]|uniref:NACHT domain-containing protein n=1 Tax=Aspergillus bertholletiae TaxID=1226010 RepID=A0A5N7BAP4_9EURO|nr:hypothetical protein BDV26DRAFT_280726 [Aspergillus bertholletiae]